MGKYIPPLYLVCHIIDWNDCCCCCCCCCCCWGSLFFSRDTFRPSSSVTLLHFQQSCLCFDSSRSIPISHDPHHYSSLSTAFPFEASSSHPATTFDLIALQETLDTSILAFAAKNCDVIQLNLREFVYGLVALYLGGALASAVDVAVAICIWRREETRISG